MLDESEKMAGRRMMAKAFLEDHSHDLHLYDEGLIHKVRPCSRIPVKTLRRQGDLRVSILEHPNIGDGYDDLGIVIGLDCSALGRCCGNQ